MFFFFFFTFYSLITRFAFLTSLFAFPLYLSVTCHVHTRVTRALMHTRDIDAERAERYCMTRRGQLRRVIDPPTRIPLPSTPHGHSLPLPTPFPFFSTTLPSDFLSAAPPLPLRASHHTTSLLQSLTCMHRTGRCAWPAISRPSNIFSASFGRLSGGALVESHQHTSWHDKAHGLYHASTQSTGETCPVVPFF